MKDEPYQIAYRTIDSDAVRSERTRAFGDDDIGQHSWTTPEELLDMISACRLNQQSVVLDVGCGAGGPAMFVAQQVGCRVIGLDIDEQGIKAANALAVKRGLSASCQFQVHDAAVSFNYADESIDLVFAIDSVFHIPQRKDFLIEVRRLLSRQGKLFFTDAGVVNGQISGEEFELRSFNGAAFFAPPGYNQAVLEQSGFEVLRCVDLTENNERIAQSRYDARVDLESSLIEVEGEIAYRGRQAYLAKVAELCRQQRLCRYGYLARKTGQDTD